MTSTTLVCVVSGEAYEKFTEDLFRSAGQFFHPTSRVDLLMLHGRSGWPEATMYRYHTLARNMPNTTYVFLSDADMLFEAPVGPEILPKNGITATAHPGYVTVPRADFPYERRQASAACIYAGGDRYYCGGFVGGTRQAMLNLANKIIEMVDRDARNGIVPKWHDESCLNRALLNASPKLVLSPSYCYPDNDTWYRSIWGETYERKLVALDKTSDVRGDR